MTRPSLVLLAVIWFASACAGAPGTGSCADARFVVANPGGLQCIDARGTVLGKVTALPPLTAPALATRQATTGRIFFTLTAVQNPKAGFGSDLMSVAPDGSDLQVVLAHESDSVFYDSPAPDRAGSFLYFHRAAKLLNNGSYVGTESTIERLELTSGRRTVIVREAADPTISNDGKTLAYVRIVGGKADGLWASEATGTNARNLVPGHTFAQVQTPRFAPNDDRIAFSASGHVGPTSGRLPHFAHLGIPSELYVVRLDGTGLRSLAKSADDLVPGWSPDGASIAFIATGSLVVTDVASASTRTVTSTLTFPYGDVVWLR
jgi:dipeptidyl aminopeptidase/acylaminoacyl peptidase